METDLEALGEKLSYCVCAAKVGESSIEISVERIVPIEHIHFTVTVTKIGALFKDIYENREII